MIDEIEMPSGRLHHLLLGGGGFIGRHVAFLLAERGHRVTIASRHSIIGRFPVELRQHIAWKSLELGAADWDALVEDVDVVHHYAWGSIPASANANPRGDLIINVSATIDLLDALRRKHHGRIIFASSGGTVYGKLRTSPVQEDHPLSPITAYGAGKATAEMYLALYRAQYGIDCRTARIANPFGAGQDLSKGLGAVTTFLHHALSDEMITIWGDGEVVRDFIHISDVAKALVTLSLAPKNAEFTFNIGSGVGVSLNQVVHEIGRHLGKVLQVTRTDARSFDLRKNVLSIDRARDILGWSPALPFADGMLRTIQDLEQHSIFSTLK